MIQPGEIQSIAGKEGVRDTQIEKDYVISWVTYGIANNPFLKENLVFKGGTVLKKVYFPDYRFSEDLDFTFTGKNFDIEAIKTAFNELIEWVYEESRISLSIQNETQHENTARDPKGNSTRRRKSTSFQSQIDLTICSDFTLKPKK